MVVRRCRRRPLRFCFALLTRHPNPASLSHPPYPLFRFRFIVKYHTLFFSTSSAYARAKKDYVAAFENSITHLAGGGAGGGGSGAAGLSGLPRLTMADLFEAPAAVPGVEAAAAAV